MPLLLILPPHLGARRIHHDCCATFKILQGDKAETRQAHFVPIRDRNRHDIVPPVRNAQRRFIARGEEIRD
jgi:hypothetical protein